MEKRLFSKNHVWVEKKDNTARIGISDYAQKKLGNIMFLNLPDVGDILKINQCFGDIESIKTVSDLLSPIDGEVVCVNESLVDEPDMINENPYECWFVEVKVNELSSELMDEERYLASELREGLEQNLLGQNITVVNGEASIVSSRCQNCDFYSRTWICKDCCREM